jgi:cysteine-rich repeat protein
MSVRPNLAGRAVAILASAVALLATACVESDTVDCDGVICPSGFSCTADGKWCTDSSCGNGVRDPGEECDDRNLDPNDDCTAVCKTATCGDGVVDSIGPVTEACDNGRNGSGQTFDTVDCDSDCTRPTCGDGHTNAAYDDPATPEAAGEQCDNLRADPAVPVDTFGCDGDCTLRMCGDGWKNPTTDPDNPPTVDRCRDGASTIPECGEVCDDGNTEPGDACSPNCLSDLSCGNTIIDLNAAVPESCDDGNRLDGDTCSHDCLTGEGCGNNILERGSGELCDDGDATRLPTDNDDSCRNDCLPNVCGDGWVDGESPRVEACDGLGGGVAGETEDCDLDCTPQDCGDGVVNRTADEQCDDENDVEGDDCRNDCLPNVCNDG